MTEPKIVTLDIETAPLVTATFNLWPKNGIGHNNIIQDSYVICAAWKWLGKKKIHGVSTDTPTKDSGVLKAVHAVLREADVIVGHNIDKFDLSVLNTRFIGERLEPLPKLNTIDTYKLAKADFKFTSNRLDYIAQYLGFEGKMDTPKGLWMEALNGNKKAVKTMLEYNKQDVLINEKVYLALRPYSTRPSVNLSMYVDDTELGKTLVCPKCGAKDSLIQQGNKPLASGTFKKYQCKECLGWSRGRENLRAKKHTGVVLAEQTVVSQ